MPKFNLSSDSLYEYFKLKFVYKNGIMFDTFMKISYSYALSYVLNM